MMNDNEIIQEATEATEKNFNTGCYVGDLLRIVKEQQAKNERLHEVINGFEEQSHKDLLQFCELSEKYENAKAENERLNADIEEMQDRNFKLFDLIFTFRRKVETAKSEAIKEFAERLKTTDLSSTVGEHYINGEMYGYFDSGGFGRIIDNLVKEMTGDSFTIIEHNSLCETETYEGRGVYERKVSDT